MRALVLALPLALLLLPACPGEAASPTVGLGTVPDGSASNMEPVEAGAAPVAQVEAGPKECGCSLCDPVVSADPCKTVDDCAPDALCHAKACVAKAKAPPMTSNVSCTRDFQCNESSPS